MKSWLMLLLISTLGQLSLHATNPRYIPFTTFQDANHNHYMILQSDSSCSCEPEKHFFKDSYGEIWYFVKKISADRSTSYGMISQYYLDLLQTYYGMLSPTSPQESNHMLNQS